MKFAIVFVALFGLALAAPAASGGSDQAAQIVRQDSDVNPDGYNYNYETSNGISGQAAGELKRLGEESAIVSKGSYSWVDTDGQQHTITYVADENGFQAQGSDIPQAPSV